MDRPAHTRTGGCEKDTGTWCADQLSRHCPTRFPESSTVHREGCAPRKIGCNEESVAGTKKTKPHNVHYTVRGERTLVVGCSLRMSRVAERHREIPTRGWNVVFALSASSVVTESS